VKNLAAALVAAQKQMPAVHKDSENQGFKRNGKPAKYVSLDKLIETTKPILAEHGLAILQPPTEVNGFPALKTILLHESGEFLEDTMLLPTPDKPGAHGLGAALTYCRRFAWASMLGVANDEDDDGNTASARQGGEPHSVGSVPSRATGSGQAGRTVAPSPPAPSTDQAVIEENQRLTAEILEIHARMGRDIAASSAEIHKHRTRNPLVDHHEWLVEALALAKRNERAGQFKPPTGAAA
jgi:hypothetical protein